ALIRGNGAAAVNEIATRREIALRLELRAIGVRSRIEERRRRLAVAGIAHAPRVRGVRSIPGDVHTAAATDRDLTAADGAGRHRASSPAVHLACRPEPLAVVLFAD